jgi:c-di-GMP-binding flagellar brake protein YcgR
MTEEEKKPVKDDFKESRRFPRMMVSVDIEYNVLKKESSEREKAVTRDISAGGICLIVYEKVDIGSILDLKIHFDDTSEPLDVRGKVVWSSHFTVGPDGRDRYDLGIEFTEVADADREKISQYLFKLK